uniref:Prephenate dehydrogenase/arogenate dehydrogenase family protein n=1 Tax=Ignisphaera aggregans TaxID=334771 RepID=A0A7C4NKK1_9CREN
MVDLVEVLMNYGITSASTQKLLLKHVARFLNMSVGEIRKQIDEVDEEIVKLLAKRLSLAKAIVELKTSLNQNVVDDGRELELMLRWRKLATTHGVPWELAEQIVKAVLVYSKKIQLSVISKNCAHRSREAVVIVGYGKMGKALATQITRRGLDVIVSGRSLDKAEAVAKEIACRAEPIEKALGMGRYVVLAIPLQAYSEGFVDGIVGSLRGRIVMDILSSKSWVYSYLEELSVKYGFYYISTHPLFGPSTPAEGQKIVIIPSKTSKDVLAEVVDFWRCVEIDPLVVSYEEHEKAMAIVQVLAHLFILSLQLTVKELSRELGVDPIKFSTPTFKELIAIAERLNEIKDTVYEIQKSNPFSSFVRSQALKSIQYISMSILGGNQ